MTAFRKASPSVVLICHEDDPIDREAIAAWLACTFTLSGIVLLRESRGSLAKKLKREYRRVGLLRLLDVILFRVVYRVLQVRRDAQWVEAALKRMRAKYPAQSDGVRQLVTDDPNSEPVREFIKRLNPDFALARCKWILRPEIFEIPRFGTYALHPGICPMYRNAHGCFWAIVNGDLENVGMTLLRIDAGIDTGPVHLYGRCAFDEDLESHIVIQHKVVLENLDAVTKALYAIAAGTGQAVAPAGHCSVNRGQPWLSAWLRWKYTNRQPGKAINGRVADGSETHS